MNESWYDRHVLPRILDCACGRAAIAQERALLLPRAAGRILEVGIGTGLNLAHYDRAKVAEVIGLEPASGMHAQAMRRAREAGVRLRLLAAPAECIPLPDASIDTIVLTFTLCSIPDPARALHEMRRVLVSSGNLLFLEHGLAPDPGVRAWQRRLRPWWRLAAGGCTLDRDVPGLLAGAGFAYSLQCGYTTGPKISAFHYRGAAWKV